MKRKKPHLLWRALHVADPTIMGILGLAMGVWGGIRKAEENKEAADYNLEDTKAQLKIYEAQRAEATNSAISQAGTKTAEAGANFSAAAQTLADQNAIGNKDLAKAAAEAERNAGARAAAVGRSGVKDTGTASLVQKQIDAENKDTIATATTSLNKQVSQNLGTVAFQRDMAFKTAAEVIASYSEGGDQFKVFEEQEARIKLGQTRAEALKEDAYDPFTVGFTIAAGAFSGLGSGISMGRSLTIK